MKEIIVKEEVQNLYNQAVNRYNLMYRKLSKLEHNGHLTGSLQDSLNELRELQSTAIELETGVPIWNMVASAFLEDVTSFWDEFGKNL